MAFQRDDIRGLARQYLYEDTADLITDAYLNSGIDAILRELPTQNIYRETIYTTTQVVDQLDYALDSIFHKVEKVEINVGTVSKPDWQKLVGWDTYGGALYLRTRPTIAYTMRIHVKTKFTVVADDSTDYDFDDSLADLVAMGAALKAYKKLMGYFMKANNWDALGKPDGYDMAKLSNHIEQMQRDYNNMIRDHKQTPRPRNIDLLGS